MTSSFLRESKLVETEMVYIVLVIIPTCPEQFKYRVSSVSNILRSVCEMLSGLKVDAATNAAQHGDKGASAVALGR